MKKILKRTCLFFALAGTCIMQAQTTWYFGNKGGLKFNAGGTTTAVTSPLATYEGSAVLVDANNNVVMYCNGTKAWNGANVQQPVTLQGDSSSTQTAVIVPIPGSGGTKAFIFTVNAVEHNYGSGYSLSGAQYTGLRVSLASISGTAPNTAITVSSGNDNINLIDDGSLMSERLDVTQDGTGGYWVLTHGVGTYSATPPTSSNKMNNRGEQNFYAFHVTCSTTTIATLHATQVVSNITNLGGHQSFIHGLTEPVWNDVSKQNQFNGQGQMKFSKDGTKIAVTLLWLNRNGSTVNPDAQLFKFNKTNGQVDNNSAIEFNLGFNTTTGPQKDAGAYGIEFSANDSVLYVSSCFGSSAFLPSTGSTGTTRVYQYNISGWNPLTITASKTAVLSAAGVAETALTTGTAGALMRGPDDKIYVARYGQPALDVINSPNKLGTACNYGIGTVPIGGSCYSGLPTTVLINTTQFTATLTTNSRYCAGSPITINGGYMGVTPAFYHYTVYGTDANGNKVDASGNPATTSWFNWDFWYVGPPTSGFQIPNSATYACAKYYTIELSTTDNCNAWGLDKKTIYVECAPTSTSSVPNPVCYGSSVTTCLTNLPSGSTTSWTNSSMPGQVSVNACITTTILNDLTLTGNVSGVCNKSFVYNVTVEKNNPDFSLTSYLPSNTSTYFNLSTAPVVTPNANIVYNWDVTEVNATTNVPVSGTDVSNASCWASSTNFNNYTYHTTYASNTLPSCASTTAGLFNPGHKYRVTRTTSTASCPAQSLSKAITTCAGCRMSEGTGITVENVESSNDDSYPERIENNNEQLAVYPNPSGGSFTVDLSTSGEKIILVYDLLGKIVFQKNTKEKTCLIDLHEQAGVYLLKISSNDKVFSKKLLIQ